jgi:hypothetical protein
MIDFKREKQVWNLTFSMYALLLLIILAGHLIVSFTQDVWFGPYVVGVLGVYLLYKINQLAREFVGNTV